MRMKPALTTEDAALMMKAAKSEAETNNWKVSIAIVDDAGCALLVERLEGTRGNTAEASLRKASSAAITHRPGKFWSEAVVKMPGLAHLTGVFPVQGGLPIIYDGLCIGGIGVGGVQSHEDEQIAAKAIEAFENANKS